MFSLTALSPRLTSLPIKPLLKGSPDKNQHLEKMNNFDKEQTKVRSRALEKRHNLNDNSGEIQSNMKEQTGNVK